jgi:hypothetical protein
LSLTSWTQITYKYILEHVTTKKNSRKHFKNSDWERFQNLASNLISSRTEINSGAEADKAALEFTASIVSVYRLSTSKVKLSEPNSDITGLEELLKQREKLRTLWQETRDPMCKNEFKWISKTIRRMTRKRALERRE